MYQALRIPSVKNKVLLNYLSYYFKLRFVKMASEDLEGKSNKSLGIHFLKVQALEIRKLANVQTLLKYFLFLSRFRFALKRFVEPN